MTAAPEGVGTSKEPKSCIEQIAEIFAAASISAEGARSPLAVLSKTLLVKHLEGTVQLGPRVFQADIGNGALELTPDTTVVLLNRAVTVFLDAKHAPLVLSHLMSFIYEIVHMAQGQHVAMVDALDVSVRMVSDTHVTFGWKQKVLLKP